MGSQWAGMGKGLLRLPIFAATIKRLQPILEPEGIDLTHTITTDNSDLFENIIYSFISIAAIQVIGRHAITPRTRDDERTADPALFHRLV
jgi:fatty acid synthase